VRIRDTCINKDENSPSHMAADVGNNDTLAILLQHGADINPLMQFG
jgi:ankyrin repeat protein